MTIPNADTLARLSISAVLIIIAAAAIFKLAHLNQAVVADGNHQCTISGSVSPLQIALDITNTFGARTLIPVI